jgi:hypothetical protein
VGQTNRDVAAFLSVDFWGLEANAIYAAYWTIVLQIQRPEGLAPLIREVDEARASWTEEPLELAGFQFDKGEQIVCATRSIHLDGEIHKDADEFIPDRYMTTKKFMKNGKSVPNHSLPFGGGDSKCEGRYVCLL